MKKIGLILAFVLAFSFRAQADICYDVEPQEASKAVEIIQGQENIYIYCSICSDAKPKIIPVKDVKKSNPVYVNGQALDLAHTYYKRGHKFINLGIASGCIHDGEYEIRAELSDLVAVHHSKEIDKDQAKNQARNIYNQCVLKAQKAEAITTTAMVEQDIKINDCLSVAIKKEIEKGFEPEQQTKMVEYLEQTRKSILEFYAGLYAQNKYCYGACGTITNILPYIDENKILMDMLEDLLYLNISKNGY